MPTTALPAQLVYSRMNFGRAFHSGQRAASYKPAVCRRGRLAIVRDGKVCLSEPQFGCRESLVPSGPGISSRISQAFFSLRPPPPPRPSPAPAVQARRGRTHAPAGQGITVAPPIHDTKRTYPGGHGRTSGVSAAWQGSDERILVPSGEAARRDWTRAAVLSRGVGRRRRGVERRRCVVDPGTRRAWDGRDARQPGPAPTCGVTCSCNRLPAPAVPSWPVGD